MSQRGLPSDALILGFWGHMHAFTTISHAPCCRRVICSLAQDECLNILYYIGPNSESQICRGTQPVCGSASLTPLMIVSASCSQFGVGVNFSRCIHIRLRNTDCSPMSGHRHMPAWSSADVDQSRMYASGGMWVAPVHDRLSDEHVVHRAACTHQAACGVHVGKSF